MENLVYIFHAVPTRYMEGRDKAPASYGIQSFTYSGWGATMRHNYDQDINKEITFLRVDPTATKMLATKAKIVGDIGLTLLRLILSLQPEQILILSEPIFLLLIIRYKNPDFVPERLGVVFLNQMNQFMDNHIINDR
jgi:hypothetical protein